MMNLSNRVLGGLVGSIIMSVGGSYRKSLRRKLNSHISDVLYLYDDAIEDFDIFLSIDLRKRLESTATK